MLFYKHYLNNVLLSTWTILLQYKIQKPFYILVHIGYLFWDYPELKKQYFILHNEYSICTYSDRIITTLKLKDKNITTQSIYTKLTTKISIRSSKVHSRRQLSMVRVVSEAVGRTSVEGRGRRPSRDEVYMRFNFNIFNCYIKNLENHFFITK